MADNFACVENGTFDLTLTCVDEECSHIVLQHAATLLLDVTPSCDMPVATKTCIAYSNSSSHPYVNWQGVKLWLIEPPISFHLLYTTAYSGESPSQLSSGRSMSLVQATNAPSIYAPRGKDPQSTHVCF